MKKNAVCIAWKIANELKSYTLAVSECMVSVDRLSILSCAKLFAQRTNDSAHISTTITTAAQQKIAPPPQSTNWVELNQLNFIWNLRFVNAMTTHEDFLYISSHCSTKAHRSQFCHLVRSLSSFLLRLFGFCRWSSQISKFCVCVCVLLMCLLKYRGTHASARVWCVNENLRE